MNTYAAKIICPAVTSGDTPRFSRTIALLIEAVIANGNAVRAALQSIFPRTGSV